MFRWIAGAAFLFLSVATAASQVPDMAGLSDEQLASLQRRVNAERARRTRTATARPIQPRPAPGLAQIPAPVPAFRQFDELVDRQFSWERQYAANAKYMQDLYVRSDALDSFAYLYPLAPLDGKGASLSFSDNIMTNTQSLNLKGYVSAVLTRQYTRPEDSPFGFFGFASAVFASADGTLTNPFRSSERNAAQFGLDNQFAFQGNLIPVQNLGFRPYFQTDLRGEGRIYGFSALYEPINVSWNLGSRIPQPQLVGLLWRILPEVNVFQVDDPGRSNFGLGRRYSFLGGTIQARAVLFEQYEGVPAFLRDRLYVNGSVTQFWDASNRGRPFHDAELEAGYIFAKGPATDGIPAPKGSISVVYNNGVSRMTFVEREQYKVQLALQY